jgi:hypothetical protein
MEFVSYEQSLELKELGFDEPCFGWYDGKYTSSINQDYCKNSEKWLNTIHCAAPLYQQAFRWFREKYSTHVEIHENTDWEEDNESWSFVIFKYKLGDNDGMISSTVDYNTYEEAELECLIKLIEIVKNGTK